MRARRVAREAIKSLSVEDGDVLVFDRVKSGLKMPDVRRIGSYLDKSGRGNCILLLVDDMDGIAALDESEMREMGWMKIE